LILNFGGGGTGFGFVHSVKIIFARVSPGWPAAFW
jgi:hypothetical protein